jgi:lipopolysaccharide cholinephosphotransferase
MNKHELSLREIQISSLQILKKIDAICTAENLDYFVMYGTLIGAARHKGFIPWDDDVDIMMPRPDYNKLISILRSGSYSHQDIKILNADCNENYPYMISRVIDPNFHVITNNEKNCGMGTFVDVYPLDNIANTKIEAIIKGRYYGWLSSLYFSSTRLKNPSSLKTIKEIIKSCSYYLAKMLGQKRLYKLLQQKSNIKDLDANYVGCIEWMTNDFRRNIFSRELLKGRETLPFESIQVNVPENYHKVLSDYYGDYMNLPPEKDQVPHHFYRAYKK